MQTDPRAKPAPLLVDESTAAEMLCVCPKTLYLWRRDGLIPFLRLGRRGGIRFAVADLEKFIAERRQGGGR